MNKDLPPTSAPGFLYRRVKRHALKRCIPLSATLELTERCTLRCQHCYILDPANRREELGTAAWTEILDQLADLGTLLLTFTGGEPLLRDDFFDIAAHARRREFSFVLFTNGTLISPHTAGRLRALQPQRVEMTLLGGTPETHDRISGVTGSFEKTLRGAKLLVEQGIKVQMKTTWMRGNIGEAERIRALAAGIGASFRAGYLLLRHRRQPGETDALEPTAGQWATMAARIARDRGGKPLSAPPPLTERQKQQLSPCGAGHLSLCIDAGGDVTPCVALRIKLGNLLETPIGNLWRESADLIRVRNIRISDLPACRSCRLYMNCKRCAGVAMAESGTMLGASPQACRIAELFAIVHEHERCSVE